MIARIIVFITLCKLCMLLTHRGRKIKQPMCGNMRENRKWEKIAGRRGGKQKILQTILNSLTRLLQLFLERENYKSLNLT